MSEKLKRDGFIWIYSPDGHQGIPEMHLFPLYQYKVAGCVLYLAQLDKTFYITEVCGKVELAASTEGGHSGITSVSQLGDEIVIEVSPLDAD